MMPSTSSSSSSSPTTISGGCVDGFESKPCTSHLGKNQSDTPVAGCGNATYRVDWTMTTTRSRCTPGGSAFLTRPICEPPHLPLVASTSAPAIPARPLSNSIRLGGGIWPLAAAPRSTRCYGMRLGFTTCRGGMEKRRCPSSTSRYPSNDFFLDCATVP